MANNGAVNFRDKRDRRFAASGEEFDQAGFGIRRKGSDKDATDGGRVGGRGGANQRARDGRRNRWRLPEMVIDKVVDI
jgi:hypothetical protein